MIIDPAAAPVSQGNGLHSLQLSAAGGLTQFGAYVETLSPGAWSSRRHWHSAEDEFLYVLSGRPTLHDDNGRQDLAPGDAVCWRHGDPNAHHLTNRSDADCRWIIVGSRCAGDICTYPDDARRLVNGDTRWQMLSDDGSVLRDGDMPPGLQNLPAPWGRRFDGTPRPNLLRAGLVPAELCANNYPARFADLGEAHDIALSDAGGLTQFGAFVEVLQPGARSSLRHWHSNEDEFLYTLDGTVTLHENRGPRDLPPGSCACWPKGMADAHCLENRSDRPVTYFVAGTRLPADEATYPDIDLHYTRRDGLRAFTRKDGTPYPGWPKETIR